MIVEPVRNLTTKDIEPELASAVQDAFFTVPEKERSVIRSHSRSFSKASSWLPVKVREDVEKLYAWQGNTATGLQSHGRTDQALGSTNRLGMLRCLERRFHPFDQNSLERRTTER